MIIELVADGDCSEILHLLKFSWILLEIQGFIFNLELVNTSSSCSSEVDEFTGKCMLKLLEDFKVPLKNK